MNPINPALYTAKDIRVRKLANARFTEKQLRLIAYRFGKFRRMYGYSAAMLAKALDTSTTTLHRIENLEQRPGVKVLARFYELETKLVYEYRVTRSLGYMRYRGDQIHG